MCIHCNIGAAITLPKNNKIHEYLFGEDQSRYIIEVEKKKIDEVIKILNDSNVFFEKVGNTQENSMEVKGEFKVSLLELEALYKYWFNNYFKENL